MTAGTDTGHLGGAAPTCADGVVGRSERARYGWSAYDVGFTRPWCREAHVPSGTEIR